MNPVTEWDGPTWAFAIAWGVLAFGAVCLVIKDAGR